MLTVIRSKRYSRLLRNNGVQLSAESASRAENGVLSKRKSRASVARAAEAKRRKIEGDQNDPLADDGDDGPPVKREPAIKQEYSSHNFLGLPYSDYPTQPAQGYQCGSNRAFRYTSTRDARCPIKLEDDVASNIPSFAVASDSVAIKAEDDSIFERFCTSELFAPSGSDSATLNDSEATNLNHIRPDKPIPRVRNHDTSSTGQPSGASRSPPSQDVLRVISVGVNNNRAVQACAREVPDASLFNTGNLAPKDVVVILD